DTLTERATPDTLSTSFAALPPPALPVGPETTTVVSATGPESLRQEVEKLRSEVAQLRGELQKSREEQVEVLSTVKEVRDGLHALLHRSQSKRKAASVASAA